MHVTTGFLLPSVDLTVAQKHAHKLFSFALSIQISAQTVNTLSQNRLVLDDLCSVVDKWKHSAWWTGLSFDSH